MPTGVLERNKERNKEQSLGQKVELERNESSEPTHVLTLDALLKHLFESAEEGASQKLVNILTGRSMNPADDANYLKELATEKNKLLVKGLDILIANTREGLAKALEDIRTHFPGASASTCAKLWIKYFPSREHEAIEGLIQYKRTLENDLVTKGEDGACFGPSFTHDILRNANGEFQGRIVASGIELTYDEGKVPIENESGETIGYLVSVQAREKSGLSAAEKFSMSLKETKTSRDGDSRYRTIRDLAGLQLVYVAVDGHRDEEVASLLLYRLKEILPFVKKPERDFRKNYFNEDKRMKSANVNGKMTSSEEKNVNYKGIHGYVITQMPITHQEITHQEYGLHGVVEVKIRPRSNIELEEKESPHYLYRLNMNLKDERIIGNEASSNGCNPLSARDGRRIVIDVLADLIEQARIRAGKHHPYRVPVNTSSIQVNTPQPNGTYLNNLKLCLA